MNNLPASTIYAALRKLGRQAHVTQEGVMQYQDGPPPSEEAFAAAVAAVQSRRIISAAQFGALFTDAEKHEIFRRSSLSANTSPTAPHFAKLHFRFAQLQTVESDSEELVQTLNLLESTGVINAARRAAIAAFQAP